MAAPCQPLPAAEPLHPRATGAAACLTSAAPLCRMTSQAHSGTSLLAAAAATSPCAGLGAGIASDPSLLAIAAGAGGGLRTVGPAPVTELRSAVSPIPGYINFKVSIAVRDCGRI
jgi:hypothetical protein